MEPLRPAALRMSAAEIAPLRRWIAPEISRVGSNRYVHAAVIGLAAVLVITFSVVQGAYDLDPHHWGLITSNAVDIARGRVPYKEIFIQYGFLSALIPYLFFEIGKNIASIIFGVSLLYASGLVGVYFLTRHFASRTQLALYAFLTAFLIHPLAIYPWPDYIAFPFITFGCLGVVKGGNDWRVGLLGGMLLGLAVLAREGLFFPLVPALIVLAPVEYWRSRDRSRAIRRLWPLAGFALTIGLFILYLHVSGLTYYWKQTAIELPKLYASLFLSHGLIAAIWHLLRYLSPIPRSEHFRQTVCALIILSALGYWLKALVRWRTAADDAGLLFIALTTGLLLSSALHLNEIFRLATSITVGIGLVFIAADRLRLAGVLFAVSALALVVGAFGPDNGDPFVPSRAQIEAATTSDRIGLFAGQRWSQDVFDYYGWYVDAMRVLQTRACGLRYLRNETRDAFLEALSPYVQYQLMPFGNGMAPISLDDWGRRLRPDYHLGARLKARDIVIVAVEKPVTADEQVAPDGHRVLNLSIGTQPTRAANAVPEGYRVFARRVTPKSWFLPGGLVTVLLAPTECGEMPPN